MKTQSSTRPAWDKAALGISFAILVQGLVVLVGWHAHIRIAVQIFHGLIPMQYNTALCFLALGAAGISLSTGRRLLLMAGGSFAALMGMAVILEYTTGLSLGIDTLFFYPWERTLSANPGRMALTTAISFFLTGGGLVILAVRQRAYALFGIVNLIPLSLALTSIIGYLFQITYVLPFSLGTQMALHTSAALLAYGIAMLGYAWVHAERGPEGLPKWCAGIGVAFLPVLLVVASALFPKQSWRVIPIEVLFSIIGVALITLTVLKLSKAKVAYKGLLLIASPLILLLIFVGLVVHMKRQSESAQVQSLHSKEVIGVSRSLQYQVTEAESTVRGYLIAREEASANSYARLLESVTQTATQLQNLVSDNPQQEAIARRIKQLTVQKMDYLSHVVGVVRLDDKRQIEEVIKERKGIALTKQIRAEMEPFSQEEDRLDAERQQILETWWQKLSWLLVAGTAAAILLASILTLLFSGSISSRLQQLRDNALNLAAGRELAPRLTGHDEIAELDRVFHDMAESLGEVTRREKAVIEGTTDGIFVKGLDQRYLMINRAGADHLGKTVEEIIGASVHDIFIPESVLLIIEQDKEILETGLTGTYELPVTTHTGLDRTFLITRAPYRDRDGKVVGIIGINRDISERKQAEQALAASERRYRHLVNSGQGLICTHDLDGKLLSVNPAAAESLGYTPREMVGRNLSEYLSPAVKQGFPHYLQQVRSETNVNGLLHLLNKQGEEHVWMYRNSRIAGPGAMSYVLGFAQDVTDTKRAEEKLRLLTQRLSLATQVGNIGVWDWDVQSNSIDWDERMFEIYGIAQGTAIDYDRWRGTVVAEDLPVAEAALQQAIARKSQEGAEYRILRSDGSLRHVQSAQGVILDRARNVVRVIGLNFDITERKRAEERLRLVVEAAPSAMLIVNNAGLMTLANKQAEQLFGYTREELMGQSVEMLMPMRYRSQHPGHRAVFAQHPTRRAMGANRDLHGLRKDGSEVPIEIGLNPIQTAEGSFVLASIINITERKLIELELKRARDTALDSVRLKSEFLANMSHEIRTPMNGVIGMTGLLMQTDLTSRQLEFTETIQSSAEALLTIIDDILDFSKIEAGLLRFEKIDFDLYATVEGTIELLAEKAQAKKVELASLVHRDVPTALQGDPGRLRQVLTNLAGNAVKFTGQGEVVVSVKNVGETASHAKLRFEIQDTGIGISAEAQQGLFRPFSQADGSTTRKYGGTGLGLAISKQLVELMGGQIGIESTPGAGSTFWFTAEFEKQSSSAITIDETVGSLSEARVLIVDDNATNRSILNHQTGSWGMIATEAESGERALELLRDAAVRGEPYDIAILDLMMPEMDGFQLADSIKADPSIAAVALVLLPSFGEAGHGERARQLGIAAYLQKPVRQSKLYNCLTAVIQRSVGTEPNKPTNLITRNSMREAEFQQKNKSISNVRIMIAEDNVVNQKVALGQLYSLGYQAEVVSNGLELLKVLEKTEFDLILMDCQMPGMDGFAATAEIRRREGATRHTTIIAMTANALDGDNKKCLAAGMDDYLSKPVKAEALRQKLERWTKSAETTSGEELSEDAVPAGNARANVIDQAQLASLRAIQQPGKADFVTEVIDVFLADTVTYLKLLHQAVAGKDVTEIRRVAHFLMGSSANIGAPEMTALYEQLGGKDGANGDAEGLLKKLDQEFVLVREALKSERQELVT